MPMPCPLQIADRNQISGPRACWQARKTMLAAHGHPTAGAGSKTKQRTAECEIQCVLCQVRTAADEASAEFAARDQQIQVRPAWSRAGFQRQGVHCCLYARRHVQGHLLPHCIVGFRASLAAPLYLHSCLPARRQLCKGMPQWVVLLLLPVLSMITGAFELSAAPEPASCCACAAPDPRGDRHPRAHASRHRPPSVRDGGEDPGFWVHTKP